MKKYFLSLIFLSVFCGAGFGEQISMVYFSPVAKNFSLELYNYLQKETIANLQDISEVVEKDFLPAEVVVNWANFKIEEINATNTNIVVVGKKKVAPKKIPLITLKSVTPSLFSSINPYVKLDSILSVNYSVLKKTKSAEPDVNITLMLILPGNAKLNPVNISMPLSMVSNRTKLNRELKEGLIKLYGMWDRYYYQPQINGSVSINVTPKDAVIEIPLLNTKLKNGLNSNIPVGKYLAIIRLTNYTTIVTNIEVAEKPLSYKFNMAKLPSRIEGAPLLGSLYIDSDFPGAKFLIIEDGITGETPAQINNLKVEDKTIIFDETVNYKITNVKVKLSPDDVSYVFVNLERKGNKITIVSTNEGALVIVNKKIAGKIENNSFQYQGNVGLYSLTLFQDRFVALRTNFTLESSTLKTMELNLTPKKLSGYFITPQASVPVYLGNNEVGMTPVRFLSYESEKLSFEFRATNYGYNIMLTNVDWRWGKFNSVYAMLSPLYGDIKVFSEPFDANLFVEGNFKGKILESGLALYGLPSKKTKLRIEKEGYKPLNTNVYISPNVENQFKFTLREAPVKVYITTLPDKGFDIYVNDEWSGVSGETIIPFELGKSIIKINKRGYKTILMNVDLKEKASTNIIVKVEKGMSEDEFIENVSNNLLNMEELWRSKLFTKAIDECITNIEFIKSSEYAYLDRAKEIKKSFENRQGFLIKVTNMFDIYNKSIELENMQDYKNALNGYEEVMAILSSFDKEYEQYFQETSMEVANKIEGVKRIIAEKEEKEEVKGFISEINPIVYEGDKYLNNNELDRAIERYELVLKKIESSSFADHPRVIEIKERVNKRIKNSQKMKKEKSAWWPNIKKSWSGFNFHIGASTLSVNELSFDSSKMNINAGGLIGINFLPFFGIKVGGFYNLSSLDETNTFLPYGIMAGANIGIPIIPQLAIFGEYFMVLSDFSKIDILNNSIVNAGLDIKFEWFGLKLYYEVGFKDNFAKTYHGIGGGITFWLNED
ncbi:MAG: PEGA domain-containing protein [Brevinematia bacterium]